MSIVSITTDSGHLKEINKYMRKLYGFLSAAAFTLAATSYTSEAHAENYFSNTTVYGAAVDGGMGQNWTLDGVFEPITDVVNALPLEKSFPGSYASESRVVFEFPVPAALTQSGVAITQAILMMPEPNYNNSNSGLTVSVYAYAADGQVTASDYVNTQTLAWTKTSAARPYSARVHQYLQSLVGTNVTKVGFVVTASAGSYITLTPNATLNVNYTVPVNNPPVVAITAPTTGTQVALGSSVTFEATATDPENLGVNAIRWTSNLTGVLGTGSPLTISTLPAGQHVVIASATDDTGLAGQSSVTVNVGAPPAYCTMRANTSSYEWIRSITVGSTTNLSNNNGGYGDYVGTVIPVSTGANTVSFVPGFAYGAYPESWRVWMDLNRDGTFAVNELVFSGSGSSTVTGTMTIPSTALLGTTRMRVVMNYGSGATNPCGTVSYGEVEDYSVNISTGTSSPPTPTYCTSRGNNSNSEWIQAIQLAGVTRSSGNNSGYGNFTSQAAIPLLRGSNLLTLTPGFASTAYFEHWRIWIDFNQDGTFGTDEVAFSGAESSTAINSSINVWTTAKAGPTRMRVSMQYGNPPVACGNFNSGEVEDYIVTIAP